MTARVGNGYEPYEVGPLCDLSGETGELRGGEMPVASGRPAIRPVTDSALAPLVRKYTEVLVRRFVPIFLALAITVAGGGCGAGLGGDDKPQRPLRLGLIAPLTGNYEPLGRDHKKAVELAVEEVNAAGGVQGHKIEIIVKDDRSTPDQSAANFTEIKDRVDLVIGSAFSNCALATIPLAEQAKVPYLSLAPADEQVDPVRPYVFVVPAISSKYAERLLQYFQATGVTKLAVAYDTKSSYAVAGFRGMQAKASTYGVTIVAAEEFQTSTPDFAPMFAKVKPSGAQALTIWATGPPAVTATKQYAAAKVGIPLVLTGAQASRLFLDPAGAAAEGVTIASSIGVVGPYLPDGPLKDTIGNLSRSFRGLYRYAPPQFAQDGYSAVRLLVAAVEHAKSIDRSQVRNSLEKVNLVTPNGVYAYSPTDHSGLTTDFIAVTRVDGGTMIPTDWARSQFAAATNR
jgi:branched-chain amino acid transport system substrate-binding protein